MPKEGQHPALMPLRGEGVEILVGRTGHQPELLGLERGVERATGLLRRGVGVCVPTDDNDRGMD